jgi:sugar phosphate permease
VKKVTYIMLNKNILKLSITDILEVVVRYGFDD